MRSIRCEDIEILLSTDHSKSSEMNEDNYQQVNAAQRSTDGIGVPCLYPHEWRFEDNPKKKQETGVSNRNRRLEQELIDRSVSHDSPGRKEHVVGENNATKIHTQSTRCSTLVADFCSEIGICRWAFEINTANRRSNEFGSFSFQRSHSFQMFSSLATTGFISFSRDFILPVARCVNAFVSLHSPHCHRSRWTSFRLWNRIRTIEGEVKNYRVGWFCRRSSRSNASEFPRPTASLGRREALS